MRRLNEGAVKRELEKYVDIIIDLLTQGVDSYDIDELMETKLSKKKYSFYLSNKDTIDDMVDYEMSLRECNCDKPKSRRPKPFTTRPRRLSLRESYIEDGFDRDKFYGDDDYDEDELISAKEQELKKYVDIITNLLNQGIDPYDVDEHLEDVLTKKEHNVYVSYKDVIDDMVEYEMSLLESDSDDEFDEDDDEDNEDDNNLDESFIMHSIYRRRR